MSLLCTDVSWHSVCVEWTLRYVYVCVGMCLCVSKRKEAGREKERGFNH